MNYKISPGLSQKNGLNINNDQTNNETLNTKTVRQLIEERELYIEKLKQNRLDIINCHKKIFEVGKNKGEKQQIPGTNNGHLITGNIINGSKTPEVIDIEINNGKYNNNNNNNNNGVNSLTVLPSIGKNQGFHHATTEDEKIFTYFAGHKHNNRFNASKKNLTVKQLLEKQRNSSHLENNHHDNISKRRTHNTSMYPNIMNMLDKPKRRRVGHKQRKIVNTLGLDPNNPIVLSDEESEVSSVRSIGISVNTEDSVCSEPSTHPYDYFNEYDLYSEHNYVLDPNLVIKANQVIKNLNQELDSKKTHPNNESQEIIENFSPEQKKMSFEEMVINHELYDQKDFAKSLNLIKSRDLKRGSIAYLNAKYPPNEISRAVYAGLETKKALLDFPRSQIQMSNKNSPKNKSKHKLLDYKLKNISANQKRVSSNWSQILENMDFSSPLGQKIVKIFPEYHSKPLKRKAIKVKTDPNLISLRVENQFKE